MALKSEIILDEETKSRLFFAARAAMAHAYAPYSKFRVGAAVLLETGEIFAGCNVENASYGLTNCAERTAIFNAVAGAGGTRVKLRAVVIVNSENVRCSPCGACRQVIGEFGPSALVIYQGDGAMVETTVADLLPDSFRM
jgi:cytidine deaminase